MIEAGEGGKPTDADVALISYKGTLRDGTVFDENNRAPLPVAQTGSNEQFLAWNARQSGVQTTASGLQYKVLKEGDGPRPTDADVTLVSYKGTLRDGTVFDQNERAPLPVAQVVPGFSEGLKLMQKGGKYRLWIKPELGYGDRDTGGTIPPNSVLTFDVELLEFIPMAVLQQMQMQQMMGGQGGAPQGTPSGR